MAFFQSAVERSRIWTMMEGKYKILSILIILIVLFERFFT